MLKNIMYSILALLIGVFIYNTYIKEDVEVVVTTQSNRRMTGVTYKKDGYRVEAEEQSEKDGDQNIYFDKAKAFFENTSIKGNSGVLDQKESDLILSGDVFGKNEINGWEISGDELRYLQSRNLFYSNTEIEAFNLEKNLTITGDYFESDSNMNNLKLEKNVHAFTEKYDLKADKSSYSETTGILHLEGNVVVVIKEAEKDGKKLSRIVGRFPRASYNSNTGILTSQGQFEVEYQGYLIRGTSINYDKNRQVMVFKKDITVEKEDIYLEFPIGRLDQLNNLLTLQGPVKGKKGSQNMEGDNGYIDTATEDMDLIGNVNVYDEKSQLTAYRAYYQKADDLLKLYGGEAGFLYTTEGRTFSSDYGEYYQSKNLLLIPNKFYFKSTDKDGQIINGEGYNLTFDTQTESGSADNPTVNKEKDYLKAMKALFDFKQAYHYLQGEVSGKYGSYDIKSTNVEVDEANQKVYIPEEYEVINPTNNTKLYGKDAIVDNIKGTITSKERTYLVQDDLEAHGDNLYYNYQDEMGSMEGNVYAYSKPKDLEITSRRADFKKNTYFNLYGDVNMTQGEYLAKTEELNYRLDEGKMYLPQETYMWSNLRDMEGRSEKGIYDINNQIYTGENYWGRSKLSVLKGDFVTYTLAKEEVYLKGNVEVEDQDTDMTLKTDELYYYKASEYALAPTKVEIVRNNILLEGDSGNANLIDKQIELENPVLTTTLGDRVSGDKLYGDYYKNEFDFAGNIDGKVYTANAAQLNGEEEIDYTKPLKFSGKLSKLFFIEDVDGNLLVTRTEIRDESKFVYNDMFLEGDYLEAQGSTQKLFAKGNSIITIQDMNKISAESIILDMVTEEAEMRNNVVLTNTSKEAGGINTKADYAFFSSKKNTVDLKGNIESYKGKTKFIADEGVFDLEKSTLSGKGNIFLSLDFETAEQSDARQKEEEKANKKIEIAMEEVKISNEIAFDTENIELPDEIEEVNIYWKSSDENIIDLNGNIYHPDYAQRDEIARLTATYIYGEYSQNKNYYIRVLKESKEEYLGRSLVKPSISLEDKKLIYQADSYGSKLKGFDKEVFDETGKILDVDKLKDATFTVGYYLEDINIDKVYRVVEDNDAYRVEEEVKSVEEHSGTESTKDIQ